MDEEPKKRTSLRWMSSAAVGIAASILLMVVLPHDPPLIPDVEKIPLSPAPSMRDSARQRWEDVAAAWEAEDFARVRTLLDASLQDAPNDTTLLYSLGLASLRMNDHERALAALRRAHQLEPDSPSDEIRWILVAALDVAGQRDAGCDLLQELSNGSGSRSEQATERLHAACVEPKSP